MIVGFKNVTKCRSYTYEFKKFYDRKPCKVGHFCLSETNK